MRGVVYGVAAGIALGAAVGVAVFWWGLEREYFENSLAYL